MNAIQYKDDFHTLDDIHLLVSTLCKGTPNNKSPAEKEEKKRGSTQ
jgi:hypothetical protein